MARYNKKLVRDRIPEIIRKNGEKPVTRILRTKEYREELPKKFKEETKEAIESAGDKKEFTKELGDVQEVLTAIYDTFDIKCGDVTSIARKRRKERGAFKKRIFLERVD